ncbi:-DDRGK domain-containing protein 1 [Babesia bigemina]|uniref:-DDRGK domain-containing protein 1 n=1 Tax=Babesia bigemina TaxID=5866 RepID=A0A061DD11_BABBI|nr:-DDRGK domain-containing protein 1 [Babesia bigemina]CDR98122.1 -DDRGK domain-containing protein 1 [Babesia bigemina]|eukprot:XP_012770308.1 -DDRGK domain-containing protein 1 [Babesia bigemina]
MDDDSGPPVSLAICGIVISLFVLIIAYIYYTGGICTSEIVGEQTEASNASLPTDTEQHSRSLTAKQLKKQELKEAKRRQRAIRDEERKERDQKKQEREDIYQQRREEKERQLHEDELKRADRAYEAYRNIVSSFVVETEGHEQQCKQFNVEDFINFVIWKKVTNLVELSAKFDLQQNEVVNRLDQLEAQGHLFGLLDERGRYIYISTTDMDTLQHYIVNSGRMHKIRNLVPFCNTALCMEPTEENASKLRAWEQSVQQYTMEV